MKIVWFSHEGQITGGAELSLVDAAKGLSRMGHDVLVTAPQPGSLVDLLAPVGVRTAVLPYRWWMGGNPRHPRQGRFRRLARNLLALKRMLPLLSSYRPDLAVTNTMTIPLGAVAARVARVTHVWYIHEFGQEDHHLHFDWGRTASMALIDRLSSRLIINSRAVAHALKESLPTGKMRIVYYAVETPTVTAAQRQADNDALQLILVGRLVPGKGQLDAIRAVARLRDQGKTVRLTLVGSEGGNYGGVLKQEARDLAITDQLEFVGAVSDPANYIAKSDVALMCSASEAFGRVTIEAMKLGKPVIGAAAGGTTELIQNRVTGLLYPPGDVAALAEQIATLEGDRALLGNLGANARRWAMDTFTMERYCRALTDVFGELVN
ncbi:MAG TPA: glycosyltransferase family 4 protein [Chloroflexota bacterium]|nr:glycosyltransferase family 4 protein [Chloroflexota bacterium]